MPKKTNTLFFFIHNKHINFGYMAIIFQQIVTNTLIQQNNSLFVCRESAQKILFFRSKSFQQPIKPSYTGL